MRDNKHSHTPQTDLLHELGYEAQDVDVRGLLKWGVYLIVFLSVMAGAAFGVYQLFIPKQQEDVALATNLKKETNLMPPSPFPLLQRDPVKEMEDFRKAEDVKLDTYAWEDKKTGTVRVPIEAAIDLTAREGLPVRGAARPLPAPPIKTPAVTPQPVAPNPGALATPNSEPSATSGSGVDTQSPAVGGTAQPTERVPAGGQTPTPPRAPDKAPVGKPSGATTLGTGGGASTATPTKP